MLALMSRCCLKSTFISIWEFKFFLQMSIATKSMQLPQPEILTQYFASFDVTASCKRDQIVQMLHSIFKGCERCCSILVYFIFYFIHAYCRPYCLLEIVDSNVNSSVSRQPIHNEPHKVKSSVHALYILMYLAEQCGRVL